VRLAHCEWSAGMMVRWQEGIPQPHREKFVGGLGGKSQILGARSQDLRMSIPIGVNAVRPIEVGGRSIFRHTSGPRGGGAVKRTYALFCVDGALKARRDRCMSASYSDRAPAPRPETLQSSDVKEKKR